MKRFFYPLFFALSIFANITIAAEPVNAVTVQEISVQAVQKFVQDKTANVEILDANNNDARKDAGVVPGAILLTSYNQYALTELPKDKNTTLVFYCYNTFCQASHEAAMRAIGAGYKDVRVMKEGIMGWNKQAVKNKT